MHEPVSFRQVFRRKTGLIQEMGCREDTGGLEGGRAQRGGQSILRQTTAGAPQLGWRWPGTELRTLAGEGRRGGDPGRGRGGVHWAADGRRSPGK